MGAPPAILSTYLGESMTNYLEAYKKGSTASYNPGSKTLDLGISCMPGLPLPSEDRNRTSPFPYGGHRFEFRAVGSSQNTSLVNTVLNGITAESFRTISESIEASKVLDSEPQVQELASELLEKHWRVIFNGDGYDLANQKELTEKGVWRIDSGIDAICRFTDKKNTQLFSSLNILTPEECAARQTVLLEHYIGTVEMEALCLVDMINQH